MAIHIKDLVDKFLAEKKKECKEQERVRQIVDTFLGPEAQSGICLKGIFKKEVIFRASSSSLSYDFELKKEKILKGVKKEFPQIKGIRIEIG